MPVALAGARPGDLVSITSAKTLSPERDWALGLGQGEVWGT